MANGWQSSADGQIKAVANKIIGTKQGLQTKLQTLGANARTAVTKAVSDRAQVQKNFEKRPNNSNYYGSTSDFKTK